MNPNVLRTMLSESVNIPPSSVDKVISNAIPSSSKPGPDYAAYYSAATKDLLASGFIEGTNTVLFSMLEYREDQLAGLVTRVSNPLILKNCSGMHSALLIVNTSDQPVDVFLLNTKMSDYMSYGTVSAGVHRSACIQNVNGSGMYGRDIHSPFEPRLATIPPMSYIIASETFFTIQTCSPIGKIFVGAIIPARNIQSQVLTELIRSGQIDTRKYGQENVFMAIEEQWSTRNSFYSGMAIPSNMQSAWASKTPEIKVKGGKTPVGVPLVKKGDSVLLASEDSSKNANTMVLKGILKTPGNTQAAPEKKVFRIVRPVNSDSDSDLGDADVSPVVPEKGKKRPANGELPGKPAAKIPAKQEPSPPQSPKTPDTPQALKIKNPEKGINKAILTALSKIPIFSGENENAARMLRAMMEFPTSHLFKKSKVSVNFFAWVRELINHGEIENLSIYVDLVQFGIKNGIIKKDQLWAYVSIYIGISLNVPASRKDIAVVNRFIDIVRDHPDEVYCGIEHALVNEDVYDRTMNLRFSTSIQIATLLFGDEKTDMMKRILEIKHKYVERVKKENAEIESKEKRSKGGVVIR